MLEREIELQYEVIQQQQDDDIYNQKIKRSPGRPSSKQIIRIDNQTTLESFIKHKN